MKTLRLTAIFSLLLVCLFFALPSAHATTICSINIPEVYGVYHPLQVFEAPCTGFNPKTSKLIGPNGVDEVAYQYLGSSGKIAFQARLPASTVPRNFPIVTRQNNTQNWVSFSGTSGPSYDFLANQLVYFGGSTAGGMTDATTYFVKRYNYYFQTGLGYAQGIEFSTTLGGSAVDITGNVTGGLTYTGFLANGTTDTFTAPNHHLQSRDPVAFSGSGGACPSGITCDGTTVYYVIASGLTANAFKVSATLGGSAIDIGNVTTGLNGIVINRTWTLLDTGAPTATATNPVSVDLSDSSRIRLTNGLGAGVDVLKLATPLTWTWAGGTITGAVVGGTTPTKTLVLTLNSTTGLSNGQKVTLNGIGNGYGPTGVWTISSHDGTHLTMTEADNPPLSWISNEGYTDTTMVLVSVDMTYNPVKGIRLSDGTWIAKDTHLFMGNNQADSVTSGFTNGFVINDEAFMNVWAANNQTYTAYFTEAGPLKYTVHAVYTTYRPEYSDGNNPYPGAVAGTGTYFVDITLYANGKAAQIKYGGDMNYAMFLDSYTDWPGTKPTSIGNRTSQAASCGTYGYAGAALNTGIVTGASNDAEIVILSVGHGFGIDSNWTVTIAGVGGNTAANATAIAKVIDQDHFSIPVDGTMSGSYTPNTGTWTATASAFQDRFGNVTKAIGYSGPVVNTSSCNSTERPQLGGWGFGNRGGMQQWVYDSAGIAGDPALAIYSGHSSVLVNTTAMTIGWHSNVGALSIFANNKPCTDCATADKAFTANNVREFDIYSGIISDLAPVSIEGFGAAGITPSTMSLEQNINTGVNLSHLYGYDLTFPDPDGGWMTPYIPDDVVNGTGGIKENYTTDTPAGYAAALVRSVGVGGQPNATQAMWTSGSSAIDSQILLPLLKFANYFVYSLVWGDGIRDICCEGVQSTYFTGPAQVDVSNALADSSITSDQKTEAKAFVALFGSILWDYDFIPADIAATGDSCGVGNQCAQLAATKERYVAAFPTQPALAPHLAYVTSTLASNIVAGIHAGSGGCSASTHYCGAVLIDSLFGIESNIKLGGASASNYTRFGPFIDFHANTLSPPDPRFDNRRKTLCYGDCEIGESSGMIGQISEIYRTIETGLSEKAISDWFCQGVYSPTPYRYPFDNFFGTALTAVNPQITNNGCSSLAMTTKNYPGVISILRANFDSANEHACAISNGDFLNDHAHPDKVGLLACYFWNIPWFADFNSAVYSPQLASTYFHNTVIRDSQMGGNWYSQITNTLAPAVEYGVPDQCDTLAFTKSSHACSTATRASDGTIQTKWVSLLNFNTAKPILHDYNSFVGPSATDGKSMGYWQNYNGQAIVTPDGSTTPTASETLCTADATAFPSVTTKHTIGSGVAGPWSFTGMLWPQLAAGGNGMNMDAYAVRADSGDEYMLSDYRLKCTNFGTQFTAGNTVAITSFTAVDGTHATVVVNGFQLLKGQTAALALVSGAGSPNVTATVDSISGTSATMSGFSGLTGSYTVVGATIAPGYMAAVSQWRLHTEGTSFDVSFLPYQKSGSAQSTPTNSAGVWTVVNGGETTTYGDPTKSLTWTNGTAKSVASLDANAHTSLGYALTGGTQEVYCATAASCVWTVTGMTAGTRCVDPGITMYADAPVTNPTGTKLCRYHPGADPITGQPSVYTVNLSTAPGTQSSVAVQSYSPSGNLYLKAGTEFIGKVASSGQATITTITPSSHGAFSLCADASGSVVCE